MPSWPPALAIPTHVPGKALAIVFVLDTSIVVKLAEELDRILWTQPVINYLILAEYVCVLGTINEVVCKYGIGSEPSFTIWVALFKAHEISKHGFRGLLN
ncbi:hypothetical protein FCV25MIE_08359 [Fagus crenata]